MKPVLFVQAGYVQRQSLLELQDHYQVVITMGRPSDVVMVIGGDQPWQLAEMQDEQARIPSLPDTSPE